MYKKKEKLEKIIIVHTIVQEIVLHNQLVGSLYSKLCLPTHRLPPFLDSTWSSRFRFSI